MSKRFPDPRGVLMQIDKEMKMINYINTSEEFESIVNKDTPEIVIYITDYCPICKRHVDEMMNKHKFSFHLFDINKLKESYKKYKMSMFIPETRVYVKGEIKFCMGGQLYDTQIDRLRNILNTFDILTQN